MGQQGPDNVNIGSGIWDEEGYGVQIGIWCKEGYVVLLGECLN